MKISLFRSRRCVKDLLVRVFSGVALFSATLVAGAQDEKVVKPVAAYLVHSKLSVGEFKGVLEQIQAASLGTVDHNDVMARYRIVVFLSRPPLDVASRLVQIARKGDKSAFVVELPLWQTATGIQIPTGLMIIKFKSDSNPEADLKLIAGHHFEVVAAPSASSANRFIVRDSADDIQRLLKSEPVLRKVPTVEYVELDVLELTRFLHGTGAALP